ncbi:MULTISPECIES: rhamnulokinase family protein [Streptacidiphilus]|uniref:Rhamnulokinase family protein n=1 Tax=Streptacidiphilus cavernicola TaxID=3342716 RepID=A0ABV6UKL3_9ACTN|nr:rhamnulokinase family protein [Streptacidiphilus jeojiense]
MKPTSSSSAPPAVFAAADLGATSGRVVLARVGPDRLDLTEVHRFANTPVRLPQGLHWDILALYQGMLDGLREAARSAPIASIGVDSWAVDYGLLDGEGRLLGNPYHYRDERTDTVADRVREQIGAAELYRANGLQHLPFNTLYQLAAEAGTPQALAARQLLLIPDLLTYWLTGRTGAEATNASTTGLLDTRTGAWSPALAGAVGLYPALLPPLRRPGDDCGTLLAGPAAATGLPQGTAVTAVASHDTASAVVAVPADRPDFGYVSCGTWSLAGLELEAPVLSEASRTANFTNELGIDGTVRYLRNIMGLWLLSESQRSWQARGEPHRLEPLLARAAAAEPFAAVIDPDTPEFLAPGDMPARIAGYCERTGQRPPADQGSLVRTILEGLALAHARTLHQAAALAGREIQVVHLVGGGSRNDLLCQFTADAAGLPVVAGPSEATALGNVLVQARAHGLVHDRAGMRRLVADTQPLRHYTPRGNRSSWTAAAARVGLV